MLAECGRRLRICRGLPGVARESQIRRSPTMYDSMTTVTVGLDVHARSVRLAAVCADELLEERTLP